MNSMVTVVIMSVNYSHDIAAALLAVSGVAMWIMKADYPSPATAEAKTFFINIYHGIARIAKNSLIWIIVGGVPRVYFYTEYEWSSAAGDLQLIAVIIKHIVITLLVGTGLFLWSRLGRKAKELQRSAV